MRDMIAVLENRDIRGRDLMDISYTLFEGRRHFMHRCAIVIQDKDDALYVLKQAVDGEKLPRLFYAVEG